MRLFAPFATYFQQSLHYPFNSSDDQKLLYWHGIDVAQAKLRELEDESSHRGHRDSGLALFRYIIGYCRNTTRLDLFVGRIRSRSNVSTVLADAHKDLLDPRTKHVFLHSSKP